MMRNMCLSSRVFQKTIDEAGNDVRLVDIKLYEDVYAGQTIDRSFHTMKKNLYNGTYIAVHKMTRTIRPTMEKYPEYN